MSEQHATITEAAQLAREAEKAGAGPQGARLAKIATHVAAGRFDEACAIRDEIRDVLDRRQEEN